MPKTITITGNSIPLPKTLAKKWQGATVSIDDSGLLVVNLSNRSGQFQEALNTMRKVGAHVTKRDLTDALKWARKQQA